MGWMEAHNRDTENCVVCVIEIGFHEKRKCATEKSERKKENKNEGRSEFDGSLECLDGAIRKKLIFFRENFHDFDFSLSLSLCLSVITTGKKCLIINTMVMMIRREKKLGCPM